jgi:nicotinamidase-related amidase
VQHAFGLNIPHALEEVCNPSRTALLVYDMQVGIFEQAPTLKSVTPRVLEVLEAARGAKIRTFFGRHMTLPSELMGTSQLRTSMIWQKTEKAADVKTLFLRDSPEFSLVPEIQPLPNEMVFDKLGMSFFAGTPLDMVLRDCGVNSLIIVGVVLEIGIAPTITNAIDLGYIPIVVTDACGSVNKEARKRALADISYTGVSITTDAAAICQVLRTK